MTTDVICACCHHKIDEDSLPVCSYCGYLNSAYVGDCNQADADALKHRRDLIAKLKNISIVGYQYGWNEKAKKYEQLSKKEYKIADGADCDGKIVWSSLDFGQWWDEEEKTVPVELTFQYGKNWTVTRKFLPVESACFWHIGVGISEDMQLFIYFGDEHNYARSSGVDFVSLEAAPS